jgi:hypothetical protein
MQSKENYFLYKEQCILSFEQHFLKNYCINKISPLVRIACIMAEHRVFSLTL